MIGFRGVSPAEAQQNVHNIVGIVHLKMDYKVTEHRHAVNFLWEYCKYNICHATVD